MSKVSKHKPKDLKLEGPLLLGKPLVTKNDLTESQRHATEMFDEWFQSKRKKNRPILRIGGAAGTGKSAWIKYIIDKYKFDAKDCYVLTYTGQATNRLRKDGVMARTIHSTIMYTIDEPVLDKHGNPITRRGVPLMRVTFKPVKRLPNSVKLVIVDEASFLPEKIEKTLLGYNVPILETGDPLQLPPVAGKQVFGEDNVDFMMTDVVRQHMDSELYDVINRIRVRENIDTSLYHDEVLFLHQQPTVEETFYRFLPFFKNADMIVVATNKTRQIITDLYRKEIIKTNSPYPVEGERVVCRQNNQKLMIDQYMLANGMQGTCMHDVGRSVVDEKADIYYMDFQPDVTKELKTVGRTYFPNLPCNIERLMAPFGTIKLDLKYATPGEHFEYAHAITAHLCVTGDTLVYTEDGIQQIGRLENYTGKIFNGKYFEKPVRFIKNGFGTINEIHLSNGTTYNVTDLHTCKVLRNDGIHDVLGKDIKPGDVLLQRVGQNLYGGNSLRYRFNNTEIYANQDVRSVYYKLPDHMTEDLALLIGLICADGTVKPNGKLVRYTKGDRETVEVFANCVRQVFGYDAKIKKVSDENAWSSEINSSIIGTFFRNMGGLNPNNKYVPTCILQSAVRYQCMFIRGFFEDGYVHLKNGMFDMVNVAFKNQRMIRELNAMLTNMGMSPTFFSRKPTVNSICRNNRTHDINASVSHNICLFKKDNLYYREHIGFVNKEKNRRLWLHDDKCLVRDGSVELSNYVYSHWNGIGCRELNNIKPGQKRKQSRLTTIAWPALRKFAISHKSLDDDTIAFVDDILYNYRHLTVESIDHSIGLSYCFEMPDTHQFVQDTILGGNCQGMEYDNVLYIDSYSRDFDYLMRLRYVAASRAKKHLTYMIPYSKFGPWFDLSHIEERMAKIQAEQEQLAREREIRLKELSGKLEPGHASLPK